MKRLTVLFGIMFVALSLSGCAGMFQVLGSNISVRSVGGFEPWSRAIDVTNNTQFPLDVRCANFDIIVPAMDHATIKVASGMANAYAWNQINFTLTVKRPGNPASMIYTYDYGTSGTMVNSLVISEENGYFRYDWR
jgi:hypothetical protein